MNKHRMIGVLPCIGLMTAIAGSLVGCGDEQPTGVEKQPTPIMTGARAIKVSDVEDLEVTSKLKGECFYAYLEKDSGHKGSFDCADGFVVEMQVDIDLLAQATYLNSCPSWTAKYDRCDDKELAEKISALKEDPNYPNSLFGKYRNSWTLLDKENSEIKKTEKFGGFRVLSLKHLERSTYRVVIGVSDVLPSSVKLTWYYGGDPASSIIQYSP